MKYIQLESFEKLLRKITIILLDYVKENNIMGIWYSCGFRHGLFKKYNKHILYKYSCTFSEYTEYLPLDVFKCMTSLLEDLICNTKEFDDKIKDDLCYHIFQYRYKVIKHAC